MVAGAGGFLSTGSGTTVGVGYVANVGSGAGAGSTDGRESITVGKVGAGSPGSGMIFGDGTVATANPGLAHLWLQESVKSPVPAWLKPQ